MGESWAARSLLPTSDCQRKEEAEDAEGLEAFHLYLLGEAPGTEDMAGDHSDTAIEPGSSQADGRQAVSQETST